MDMLSKFKVTTAEGRSLLFSIALTGVIMVVEVVGGFLTNSLALLSDGVHMFADVFSLALALFAIMLSAFPASDTRTYGWHRTEVFAALINGVALVAISGVILYEAVQRISHPEPVKSIGMLAVALLGLIVNLVVMQRLHGHGSHDLNMRSAFLHVLGDALFSVGVVVGGAVIYFTGWNIVDPILSIAFSLVILAGASRVLYDSAHILLEGVPKGMDIQGVVEEIKRAKHVVGVHRVHLWSICSSISALSAHIMIDPDYHGERKSIINDINCRLVACFHINHTTLQLEKGQCEFNNLVCDITHCEIPRGHGHGHGHGRGRGHAHEAHEHEHEHEHEHAH